MKSKIILALFVTAATMIGCGITPDENGLKTGDLIFVGLPWDYSLSDSTSISSAIIEATGDKESLNMIHVAIAEVQGDSTWIIDATIKHGVDRYPLDTFLTDFTLRDGSHPAFIVKRVSGIDTEGFVENAKAFIGEPYDVYFLPENGAMYCSELVYDSYINADGDHLFDSEPMNFKNPDGEMPAYWEQLFARLNAEVPQGIPGTNPQNMCNSAILETIDIDLCNSFHK